MNRSNSSTAKALLLSALFLCLPDRAVSAAELQPETAAAFDQYIQATETRIASELRTGPFLFVDALPEERRREAYAHLRDGQIRVEQVNTMAEGHPIEVPHGLIHDWIGVLFIPDASLARTLAIVQDYNNHQNIYKPDVRNSKLLERDGDHFKVSFQLYKKSLVTVAINANFDVDYQHISPSRVVSRAVSTRLAEVENPGQPSQRELPVDDGHGYLWRLNTYWRFEEEDGGVYVQLESVGLSRGVPAIIAWLVNPLLKSIPRGTLTSLLTATRSAVANPGASSHLTRLQPQPTFRNLPSPTERALPRRQQADLPRD